MTKLRNSRQESIKWIVRNKAIRTQQGLVSELRLRGFTCTQATISRDIAEMGLRKLPEGTYALAEDLYLKRMVSEFVIQVESVYNQVVISTHPGTAPGVAAAIDAAELPDIMGSLAGNDTVLAIARSTESAHATTAHLRMLMQAESLGR